MKCIRKNCEGQIVPGSVISSNLAAPLSGMSKAADIVAGLTISILAIVISAIVLRENSMSDKLLFGWQNRQFVLWS